MSGISGDIEGRTSTGLSAAGVPAARPRAWWLLLLPFTFLLHFVEEWFAGDGLLAWAAQGLGISVSPTRLLVINGIAWPVFAVLTVLGILRPRLAGFPTALATLMVVNACLHALGTLATSAYSPGLITGIVLYLPLGIAALLHGRRTLEPGPFQLAVILGVLLHAAVTTVALA